MLSEIFENYLKTTANSSTIAANLEPFLFNNQKESH